MSQPLDDTEIQRQIREGKQPEGLGDTIEQITTALGIKKCGGCEKRRQMLNKMVPYTSEGKIKKRFF